MTTESTQDTTAAQWTVEMLLDLFDAQPAGDDRFTAQTGVAAADERQVVEGTQVLAQAIVAVAKRFPDKSVRSAYAVFSRVVLVGPPVEFEIDVVSEGGPRPPRWCPHRRTASAASASRCSPTCRRAT